MPDTLTLHVPFRVVKRGGRKEMHLPEGATHSRRTDNALVKALARAFRWKQMLETGEYATIAELADREGDPRFLTRLRTIMERRRVPKGIIDSLFASGEAAPEQGELLQR